MTYKTNYDIEQLRGHSFNKMFKKYLIVYILAYSLFKMEVVGKIRCLY